MKKIAFVFPGQGAQSVGMGYDAYQQSENAKKVFDKFDEISGRKISKICFEGPEDELKLTNNTQPAILATSIARLEEFKTQTGIKADFVAGHSLGEYGALYEAGVLSLEDTIKAISKRAEFMSQSKGGAMAAILGLDENKVKEIVENISKEDYVDVANYNTPVQIVITGSEIGIEKASKALSEAGARRVVPLAVSGAFHSKMMENAGKSFEEFVKTLEIKDAQIPVITNVDAKETKKAQDFKEKMSRQIYSSVYWTQTIKNLEEQGVETIYEIGPGKVLSGLIKKISPNINVVNIFDMNCINNIQQ